MPFGDSDDNDGQKPIDLKNAGVQDLIRQAEAMKERLLEARDQAKTMIGKGSAGGDLVTAVADGNSKLISLSISKAALEFDDLETLQDMVLAACNNALDAVQGQVRQRMDEITGGMDISGLL